MSKIDFVREQSVKSLKVGVAELKKECSHQRYRLRSARKVTRLHQQRLKDLNQTLRAYRRELHRRVKNGKHRNKK